jgi:hypothetical protein
VVPEPKAVYNRGVQVRAVVVALWALLGPGCRLIADFPADPSAGVESSFVEDFRTSGDEPAAIDDATVTFDVGDASERWLVLLSGLVRSPLLETETLTPTTAEISYTINRAPQGVAGAGGWTQLGSFQHFALVTGVTGTQTVEVALGSTTDGATASVEDLSVVAARLPSGARVFSEELTERGEVDGGSYELLTHLEVPADVTGDLLVLAVVNATDEPGYDGVHVRIERPGGIFMPELSEDPLIFDHFRNPDETPRSLFAAWVEAAGDGERRFEVQAQAGNSRGATVTLVRLLAIPLGDLRSVAWDIQDHATYTNNENDETLSEVTVSAPDAPPYVIVQTVVLGDYIPTVYFFGPHRIEYEDITFVDADYTLSFGTFALQETTEPIDLEIIYHGSTGGPWCNARAAASFVIGL